MSPMTSTAGRLHSEFVLLLFLQTASLRITFNFDGAPITSTTHTHPSYSQTSRPLTSTKTTYLANVTGPVPW